MGSFNEISISFILNSSLKHGKGTFSHFRKMSQDDLCISAFNNCKSFGKSFMIWSKINKFFDDELVLMIPEMRTFERGRKFCWKIFHLDLAGQKEYLFFKIPFWFLMILKRKCCETSGDSRS